jgi:sporulation protein YtfJ
MANHPIEGLMKTTMENIKEMVDVNTIVGDPIESPDGCVIVPISRVTFGFASGGGEIVVGGDKEKQKKTNGNGEPKEEKIPFAGGSGAGVSIHPIAFMVVGQGQIRLLPVNQGAMLERIIDYAPQLIEQVHKMFTGHSEKREKDVDIKLY